jgi:hypothetical protein
MKLTLPLGILPVLLNTLGRFCITTSILIECATRSTGARFPGFFPAFLRAPNGRERGFAVCLRAGGGVFASEEDVGEDARSLLRGDDAGLGRRCSDDRERVLEVAPDFVEPVVFDFGRPRGAGFGDSSFLALPLPLLGMGMTTSMIIFGLRLRTIAGAVSAGGTGCEVLAESAKISF